MADGWFPIFSWTANFSRAAIVSIVLMILFLILKIENNTWYTVVAL
jgi:hypothetical protein